MHEQPQMRSVSAAGPESAKPVSTHTGARHFCHLVRERVLFGEGARGLVVGCGRGHEAEHIHEDLRADLVGIDPDVPLEAAGSRNGFSLFPASALNLPFRSESFDFVFFHHVIEHVPDPARSLEEISRVLKPGGWLYMGTPNRHRLLGYVASHDATFREKIAWNAKDYWARLRFRFRNEYGAHAGFTQKEFARLASPHFSNIEPLTRDYLRFKFGRRVPRPALGLATAPILIEVAAPAIYALCRK